MSQVTTTVRRVTLLVFDLGCGGGAAATVERILRGLPGVRRAYVNPADATAYVDCDATVDSPDDLTAALAKAGYRAGKATSRTT